MITISVDENNDIYLDASRNLAMASDKEALRQVCAQVSKAMRGEFLYAQNDGVNYRDFVWTTAKIVSFEASLSSQLLQLPGVLDVTDFNVTRDGDLMVYTVNVHTVYGEIPLNASL
ncbi:baseplate wedge subunit [Burkholderia phage Bm1]